MDEIQTIGFLLQQTESYLTLRAEQAAKAGSDFNVFRILRKEDDEVNLHSRFLFALLNPEGDHNLGFTFLDEFFRIVLKKPVPRKHKACVYREYQFESGDTGRIDILIKGHGFCYPVEVKINAPDQELQVKRYSDFAILHAGDGTVYYLTLNGASPSDYSVGTKPVLNLVCISFEHEIHDWLMKCCELVAGIPPIYEVIQQYLKIIDQLTAAERRDRYMEMVQKMIASSKASYESARAIADSLPFVYTDLMCRVFNDIKSHIGNQMPILINDYKEKAIIYNQQIKCSFPSIVYTVCRLPGNKKLCLIIEVYWRLYVGLSVYDSELNRDLDDVQSLRNYSSDPQWENMFATFFIADRKDAWIRLLPEDESPLDFWNCDGIYPDLFDSTRYDEIMGQVFSAIDYYINTLRNLNMIKN